MLRRFTPLLLLATLLGTLAAPAFATKRLTKEFKTKYASIMPQVKTSECAPCHVDVKKQPSKMNAYGKDFKAQKGKAAEKFAKLEKLDSDKDGFTNLDEIKAGSNPGDAKATPKAASSNTPTTATAAMQPVKVAAPPQGKNQTNAAPKEAAPAKAEKK